MSSTDGPAWEVKIDDNHRVNTRFDTKKQAVEFVTSHASNTGGGHSYEIYMAPPLLVPAPVSHASFADTLAEKSRLARKRKTVDHGPSVDAFWQQFTTLAKEASDDGKGSCTVVWSGDCSLECIDAICARLQAERLDHVWNNSLWRKQPVVHPSVCEITWLRDE
jgi:hypothetical protein